ncbi:MAG: threonylcarbamoyl-AMP synthase [Bacteroidetes bacterium GWF2_40_14]|nr:MAG: threonylcarbamoyl-AMP synthase [Bacteroidetes bacterium GWF2_40_14]
MEQNQAINEAIKVLRAGGVILYPTDTIWGLGCDATNPAAVEKIYKIKKRTDSKSLITLVDGLDMLYRYIKEVPEIACQLIEVSDSPLTIIYPGAIGLAPNIVAEDGSAGIRIPEHPFCQQLISKFRRPIVSTSANISGENAPSGYHDISDEIINSVDWIADPMLEEGSTGKPSSIIMLGLGGEIKIIRN